MKTSISTALIILAAAMSPNLKAQWATSGVNIYNTNTGNVGIGTSSPAAKLHVTGGDALINSITIGFGSGAVSYNTALGSSALFLNTTGYYNTGSGFYALRNNTTGNKNTGIGTWALASNTIGNDNAAYGTYALYANTNGNSNTASGSYALNANTLGNSNTASGSYALNRNTKGNANTAYGYTALRNNTTGYSNVAIGVAALNRNTTGANLVAVGDSALFNLSTYLYSNNTAIGSKAMYSTNIGYDNTAIGCKSLYTSTTGIRNTAVGSSSLYSNTGSFNTAVGNIALYHSETGASNTAVGYQALYENINGDYNVACGYQSLAGNTTGLRNTAIGAFSGNNNANNLNCSFFGCSAGQTVTTDFTNSMALGYASHITDNNQVRIGNSIIASIGGFQNWTNISDGRYKKEIKENVPGLKFINKLKAVTYHLDVTGIKHFLGEDNTVENNKDGFKEMSAENKARIEKGIKEKELVIYSGLVAQDVEKAAQEIGYDFSGVDKPKDEHGLYGLRYAEFVVPLVKAVQELSAQNETLKIKNETLENKYTELQKQINDLKAMITGTPAATQQVVLTTAVAAADRATLEQNIPNPFKQNTVINYYLPQHAGNASIKVTGINGETIKTVQLNTKGKGQLTLQTAAMAAGTYAYSLIVDGRLVDTKKMVVTK